MPASNGNHLIAKAYRTKYPDMPTKKLARIMYAENNIQFKGVDNANSSLRYIEGKIGTLGRSRKTVKNSEGIK